jgi:hypothetical protein
MTGADRGGKVRCHVREQFCEAPQVGHVAAHQCVNCEKPTCLKCAVQLPSFPGHVCCFVCARELGFPHVVQSRLVELGGTVRRAEPPPWGGLRR